MKTILIDAWNTLITSAGVDSELHELLEGYPNKKILVTNANEEERNVFGMKEVPYELFSLAHHPEKTDPYYFELLLERFSLQPEEVVYIEHNSDAIASAASVGISSYWYGKDKRDTAGVAEFLENKIQ